MAHKRKKSHPFRRRSSGGRSNYRNLGLAAAAGVAAVVGLGFAQTKVEMLRTHWYAAPAVLAVGGALLVKRMPTIAIALLGAAGVFGYMGFKANADAVAAQSGAKSGLPATPATAGFQDAGRIPPMGMLRRDSGMYERGTSAGSMQGVGARSMLAGQAGALLGPGASEAMNPSRFGAAGIMHD
jgi:hypothetical protein